MSPQLPPQPHLDVLKKQARQLLNDHQAGQPEAVSRVQAVLADLPPSAAEGFTLRHAQQVLAREYGFTSWKAMADHVGQPASGDPSGPSPWLPDHYDQLARDLVTAWRENRLLPFGRLGEDLRARLPHGDGAQEDAALEQARLAVAAASSCSSWADLAQKVAEPAPAMMDLPQLQGFERLHGSFARLLATRVASILEDSQTVEAEGAFTDQTTYGEFILSLAVGTQSFRYAVEGLGSDIVLAVGPGLAEALIVPGQGDPTAQARRLGEGMARDLEAVWARVTRFSTTQVVPHTDPWAIGTSPMYEVYALMAVEVKAERPDGELSGLVEACYPVRAIHGVLDSLPDAPEDS